MEEKITITKKPEITLDFHIQQTGSRYLSINKYDISKNIFIIVIVFKT